MAKKIILKVEKYGDSYVFKLPKYIRELFDMKEGDKFDISDIVKVK